MLIQKKPLRWQIITLVALLWSALNTACFSAEESREALTLLRSDLYELATHSVVKAIKTLCDAGDRDPRLRLTPCMEIFSGDELDYYRQSLYIGGCGAEAEKIFALITNAVTRWLQEPALWDRVKKSLPPLKRAAIETQCAHLLMSALAQIGLTRPTVNHRINQALATLCDGDPKKIRCCLDRQKEHYERLQREGIEPAKSLASFMAVRELVHAKVTGPASAVLHQSLSLLEPFPPSFETTLALAQIPSAFIDNHTVFTWLGHVAAHDYANAQLALLFFSGTLFPSIDPTIFSSEASSGFLLKIMASIIQGIDAIASGQPTLIKKCADLIADFFEKACLPALKVPLQRTPKWNPEAKTAKNNRKRYIQAIEQLEIPLAALQAAIVKRRPLVAEENRLRFEIFSNELLFARIRGLLQQSDRLSERDCTRYLCITIKIIGQTKIDAIWAYPSLLLEIEKILHTLNSQERPLIDVSTLRVCILKITEKMSEGLTAFTAGGTHHPHPDPFFASIDSKKSSSLIEEIKAMLTRVTKLLPRVKLAKALEGRRSTGGI